MKPIDQNLLRPNQVQDLKSEQENLQRELYGGVGAEGQLPGYRSQGSGEARQRLRSVDKMLRDQSPDPLTGAEADAASKLEKELRTEITHGMLSAEEMRKCPATAVDRHIRWERLYKAKINRWKNLRLQLNAGSDERDIANLEQYRPASSGHRIMTDGVIPGLHTMSELAKENWPLGDPKCDTALTQNKRVRKEMSEENKQKARDSMANARAIRAAKQAERYEAAMPQQGV